MTCRERVISAILHQKTDIIPYSCGLTILENERVVTHTGDPDFMSKQNSHMIGIEFPFEFKEVEGKPGYFRDFFGVVWNRSGVDKDIGVIDVPLIPDIDARTYVIPTIIEADIRAAMEALMARRGDKFAYGAIGFSLFERAWTLCTMEGLLMGMITSPTEVMRLFDDICEHNLKVLDIMLDYDVDAIYFGDDWGQQRGLIMGPDHWRRFIKPQLARMYNKVKSKGKFVLQHSCGDISSIFQDVIDIGLDVYNTFQPEIYDMRDFKRTFGKHLTVWGAISTQRVLPSGTPEQVRDVVIETMRILGEGGGYIAAPTHAVPYDVPPENLLAMLDVFHNQEKYL